ncbi:MAG: aminotransferase DegT [Candidatus Marinimicrobia bacterium]|nr:aminotransferase DegT [Candidatus Neomarinimicrobiota bacterium]|tara:strand:+ start:960 stop:2105 length:1146 start_codon:yes stop_codon:yes gene_type:complete
MINIFEPSLGEDDLNAIRKVFVSKWIGKGDVVNLFEKNFANSLNSNPENFLSTTSCTEGIFLASKLFNFNKNDEIILPSISFPSIASSISESSAKIVFCDVEKNTLNPTAEIISNHITKRTKAVFLTHYGGFPIDFDPIKKICDKNNIIIIEDSACAVKSFYKGKACGTLGDMGIWSFDAMKTLSTVDGGMIYLKNRKLVEKAKMLLYLGLPLKTKSGIDSSDDGIDKWWEFDILNYGRRAIMNNVTAAIGNVQLQKLDRYLMKRKEIYDFYFENLNKIEELDIVNDKYYDFEFKSSYYFYWIQSKKRDELAGFLKENGVYTTFRYFPLHKIKLFGKSDCELPNSDFVNDVTLNIPIHHNLSKTDVKKIADLIQSFFNTKK